MKKLLIFVLLSIPLWATNRNVKKDGSGFSTTIQTCLNAMSGSGGDSCTVFGGVGSAGDYSTEDVNIPDAPNGTLNTLVVNGSDRVVIKSLTLGSNTWVIGGSQPRPTMAGGGLHVEYPADPRNTFCATIVKTKTNVTITNTHFYACNSYFQSPPDSTSPSYVTFHANTYEYGASTTTDPDVGVMIHAYGAHWTVEDSEFIHVMQAVQIDGDDFTFRRNKFHDVYGRNTTAVYNTSGVPLTGVGGSTCTAGAIGCSVFLTHDCQASLASDDNPVNYTTATVSGNIVTWSSVNPNGFRFYNEAPGMTVRFNGTTTKYTVLKGGQDQPADGDSSDYGNNMYVYPTPPQGAVTVQGGHGGNCHGEMTYAESSFPTRHMLVEKNSLWNNFGHDNKVSLFQGEGCSGDCHHVIFRYNDVTHNGGGLTEDDSGGGQIFSLYAWGGVTSESRSVPASPAYTVTVSLAGSNENLSTKWLSDAATWFAVTGVSASMSGSTATFTAGSNYPADFVTGKTFNVLNCSVSGYNSAVPYTTHWTITGGGSGTTSLTATASGTTGLSAATGCTLQFKFTKVGSSPAVGEYTASAGVYTFNAADASRALTFEYFIPGFYNLMVYNNSFVDVMSQLLNSFGGASTFVSWSINGAAINNIWHFDGSTTSGINAIVCDVNATGPTCTRGFVNHHNLVFMTGTGTQYSQTYEGGSFTDATADLDGVSRVTNQRANPLFATYDSIGLGDRRLQSGSPALNGSALTRATGCSGSTVTVENPAFFSDLSDSGRGIQPDGIRIGASTYKNISAGGINYLTGAIVLTTTVSCSANDSVALATLSDGVTVLTGTNTPYIGAFGLANIITSFTRSKDINIGASSTLTWTTTDCVSASISPGVGGVGCNSNTAVSPKRTTTYTLSATDSLSNVSTQNVTVLAGGRVAWGKFIPPPPPTPTFIKEHDSWEWVSGFVPGPSTHDFTVTSTIPVGGQVVIVQTGVAFTVTDDASNSYSCNTLSGNGVYHICKAWLTTQLSSGNHITAHIPGDLGAFIATVVELTNTTAQDIAPTLGSTFGDHIDTPTATTNFGNELIISFFGMEKGTSSPVVQAPATLIHAFTAGAFSNFIVAFQPVTSLGSYSHRVQGSGFGSHDGVIVTYH
jgi:hypothetical protein